MLLLLCFLFCLEMKLKRGKKKLEKNKELTFFRLSRLLFLSLFLSLSFISPTLSETSLSTRLTRVAREQKEKNEGGFRRRKHELCCRCFD